jgi:tetratricopeptide (TPR) repeat protein
MSETLQYIESYFQNELTQDERLAFENRCINDEAFASEIAFYISARQAIKDQLIQNKQKEWIEPVAREEVKLDLPTRKIYQQNWFRYAAAASVIILIALYFETRPTDPKELAANYIGTNYQHLSQKMSVATDSIELGKAAYNHKNYSKAAQIFEAVSSSNMGNADLIKYRGLVYLQLHSYDKAIAAFDSLASMQGLYSNPGLFLQAIALLMRNNAGDLNKSKQLLQQVIREGMEGKEEAEKWLSNYK